jgi:transposase
VEQQNKEIHWKDLKISQLTHEMAILKRWRFGRAAEEFHGLQRSLLEESIDEDLGGIEIELDQLREPARPKKIPVRAHLPLDLPRVHIQHEPENTLCACGCQMKDRRGCRRETRLHPGDVPGGAACARQMGLRDV